MAPQSTRQQQLADRLEQMERTVEGIEQTLAAFADEVRTRQIVVVDDEDHPRIVGEVFSDVAELRLEMPRGDGEPASELLLFAVASTHPGPVELGPAIGMQLRTRGRAVFELEAWPGPDGVWRPHLHLSGS